MMVPLSSDQKNLSPAGKERSKPTTTTTTMSRPMFEKKERTHPKRNNRDIRKTYPRTKDITMNGTIIRPPPSTWPLPNVIGTSRDINLGWHQVSEGVSILCPVCNIRYL